MPTKRKALSTTGEVLDPRADPQWYTKTAINSEEWSDAEIRSEYSRLRDIAKKRLERLARNEPGSYAYRHNVGQYPKLADIGTEGAREKLPMLARFIGAKTGSVAGIREQRAQALSTLHEHGYTFVNKSNLREFGEFMESWRADKALSVSGSPIAAELFGAVKERKMDIEAVKEQFGLWLEATRDLQHVAPPKKGNASNDYYQREVNKLRKARGQKPLRKKRQTKKKKA